MQDESARQDSVEMEMYWNLQLSKFVNHNGVKMVDICVWNVNKLTARHGPKWDFAITD